MYMKVLHSSQEPPEQTWHAPYALVRRRKIEKKSSLLFAPIATVGPTGFELCLWSQTIWHVTKGKGNFFLHLNYTRIWKKTRSVNVDSTKQTKKSSFFFSLWNLQVTSERSDLLKNISGNEKKWCNPHLNPNSSRWPVRRCVCACGWMCVCDGEHVGGRVNGWSLWVTRESPREDRCEKLSPVSSSGW